LLKNLEVLYIEQACFKEQIEDTGAEIIRQKCTVFDQANEIEFLVGILDQNYRQLEIMAKTYKFSKVHKEGIVDPQKLT
jgi:hypothetical protein